MHCELPEQPVDPDLSKPESSGPAEPHPISRSLVLFFAVACGATAANLYYNQPLLGQISGTFGVSSAQVGAIPTLTQVGYAVGMFFLVPLGDTLDRRRLVTVLLAAVAVALGLGAMAANLPWLAIASLAIGITTVVPQVLIPFAAQMTPPAQRGKTIGTIMAGLLTGILLSRTLSGIVGEHFGWRAVYWLAAGLMVAFLVVLPRLLPHTRAAQAIRYPDLLRSLVHLARSERTLQQAALNGLLLFACFSAFWATLVFRLATSPFHYGAQVAGLFGIIGAAGALAAPVAGRFADRAGPRRITTVASAGVLASFAVFYLFGSTIAGLVAGVLLLDVFAQMGMIANQTRIYSLPREVHSRVNTVYMVCYFVGGATGSLLATVAWRYAQWIGVCEVGIALSTLALLIHLAWKPTPRAVPEVAVAA